MSELADAIDVHDELDAETFVREALRRCEYEFREMALLALGSWETLDIVAPELFRSVANLQRPSWGHWNGLLGALRDVRKRMMCEGTAEQRERVLGATVFNAILEQLDSEADPELVAQLRPLGQQTRGRNRGRSKYFIQCRWDCGHSSLLDLDQANVVGSGGRIS